jgi:HK97 family phage prohead protease
MARVFKLNSVIKSVTEDNNRLKIVGYASTADTDRVGDVIVPDAWTKGGLNNYQNNPILLFNHNYSQPIGKATKLEVDSTGLRIEAEISESAGPTYGLVKDGVLSTFSVGFMIKDADYNQTSDGYIIRDAELLEVSVVSVPCNQAATFSVSKSLKSAEELAEFNKEFNITGQEDDNKEVNTSTVDTSPKPGTEVPPEKKSMTPEEIAALVADSTAKALAAQREADRVAAEKAAAEKAAEEKQAAAVKVAAEAIGKTVEEKLLGDFETRLKSNNENFEKVLAEMKGDFEAKSADLRAMSDSKRMFSDRGNNSSDPIEKNYADVETAVLLSRALRKGVDQTDFGKSLMEKFNTHSTVTVGTDRLETTVTTNIEKDIEAALILKPMFREIVMNSAQQSFPIAPDAGYAEITSATTASGGQPNGNIDQRGAGYGAPYQGITLTEKLFSTVKMIGRGYLGNETEEDAIIPILPIVKDAMVRSHARGIENLILAGNTNQGVYTSGAANGLLKFASTANRTVDTEAGFDKLTAANLFSLRKLMGLRGRDPRDIVYIVSQDAWYQLAEDPEFLNADQVTAANAVKLTGTVGRVYNSDVLVCDEFAPAGPGNYFALALNAKNFVIPRLRGMTVESEYSVDKQHTVLVSSQRLGFDEIIPNAASVIGLRYAA